MRNLINKAGGVAIAMATAALLNTSSASAQEGATVFIDFQHGCFFRNANGVGFELVLPPEAVVQAVLTPSGDQKFTCTAVLSAGTPNNRAVMFSGDDGDNVLCGIPNTNPPDPGDVMGTTTDDWHQVVTKTGRASLTCHINGQP